MRLVVADTSPLHYLALIDQLQLLPALFERILIPETVRNEMLHAKAPDAVHRWILDSPEWLEVVLDPIAGAVDPLLTELDNGELAAVLAAESLKAALLLMDDRAGVIAVKRKGLIVTGTLGILSLAAERGLIDLEATLAHLKATNFRYSQRLIDRVIRLHRERTRSASISPPIEN